MGVCVAGIWRNGLGVGAAIGAPNRRTKMQKDYVALARANRLFALAELKTRQAQQSRASNVTQFPVSANRNRKPLAVFTTSRGKRMSDLLAA